MKVEPRTGPRRCRLCWEDAPGDHPECSAELLGQVQAPTSAAPHHPHCTTSHPCMECRNAEIKTANTKADEAWERADAAWERVTESYHQASIRAQERVDRIERGTAMFVATVMMPFVLAAIAGAVALLLSVLF